MSGSAPRRPRSQQRPRPTPERLSVKSRRELSPYHLQKFPKDHRHCESARSVFRSCNPGGSSGTALLQTTFPNRNQLPVPPDKHLLLEVASRLEMFAYPCHKHRRKKKIGSDLCCSHGSLPAYAR